MATYRTTGRRVVKPSTTVKGIISDAIRLYQSQHSRWLDQNEEYTYQSGPADGEPFTIWFRGITRFQEVGFARYVGPLGVWTVYLRPAGYVMGTPTQDIRFGSGGMLKEA